ncbi:MAG TPA: hypothetical protein VFK34_08425 [Marmoricola sp.]|jgi:hypothetical protein|nr:hypothetical protein [Marmoricola sp.]
MTTEGVAMFDNLLRTEESQRKVGRFAWAMAWFGLVMGQLHALSRHNTADGKEDLQLPLTAWWSDPARKALKPLLDWADPDTVYLTYGKIWLPVFLAFTLCAFVVYRRRRPAGFQKWLWRVVLFGYALGVVSVAADYWTQWTDYNPFFEVAFVALTIPAFVVIMFGSTALGITLLVKRFRPVTPALLLTLQIPLALGILQFTSMGSAALPVMFAFAILGRRIALGEPVGVRTRRELADPVVA